jgi:hypothetical protein
MCVARMDKKVYMVRHEDKRPKREIHFLSRLMKRVAEP